MLDQDNKIKAASWAFRHQPTNLKDYIFQSPTHQTKFIEMVEQQNIPNHLLFSGVQGTGKTTLADILIRSMPIDMEYDVKRINASDENSVDDMRTKIKAFIQTFAHGSFKVVLLDEADRLSPAAQGLLRGMMDEYVDVARFILTCNYDHRIIPALKSRCMSYHFKAPDATDIALYVAKILKKEKVKASIDVIDKYVTINYPDIRKIVQTIQQHVIDGELTNPTDVDNTSDFKLALLEAIVDGDWKLARQLVCSTAMGETEWDELYIFLYKNLSKCSKWKPAQADQAVVLIADYMDKHTRVADPEINAAALFIQLSMV